MTAVTSAFGGLRALVFGISADETKFSKRGFQPVAPDVQGRLEQIGGSFVAGYCAAVRAGGPEGITALLDGIAPEQRGFAFEGAGMGFSLLDILLPWGRGRFSRFVEGEGAPHFYMALIGAGWALARLRRPIEPALKRLDPVFGWLALDGYGFHEGYFGHPRSIGQQLVPARLEGYARRGFDQGLGRSMWFVCGADVDRVAATIGRFSPERHGDMWSGVGLACAYAGGVPRQMVETVRLLAGEHAGQLAQGASFAATARHRGGNPADHTDMACTVLCGCSASRAAAVVADAQVQLPPGGAEPSYEVLRQRIRAAFRTEVA
jgi:enediyne biosynthesis protein E3